MFPSRPGFSLAEFLLAIGVLAFLALMAIVGLEPTKHFANARNAKRQEDLALIADALGQYSEDIGRDLLLSIPLTPASAVELCADTKTGSCASLLALTPLATQGFLASVPLDPLSKDADLINEHSRYFLVRPSPTHVTVSAPDTEGGEPMRTVTR